MARPAEDERSDRAWRTFAPNPSEVFAARHFVACVLQTWGMEIEDLPLLVSELATNAVLHARSDFEVTVIRMHRCVRVEVFDQNTRLPSFAGRADGRVQRTWPDATEGTEHELGRRVALRRR